MDQPNLPKLTRRHFGFALSATAASAAFASPSPGADKDGWIDAHVHVWTPDVQQYPIADGFTVDDMKPRSFVPEELFAHSRPVGVDRIVLIQMSFYRDDNRYMLDMMAEYPDVFSGIGIVDHHASDVAARMKSLSRQGVRGFRIHPARGEAAKWSDDDGMLALWRTATENDLAVCPLINPQDMTHVDTMVRKFPDTNVVIDHFARVGVSGTIEPDRLRQLCDLARHPKVHVKTSAFYALGKKQPPYNDLLSMIRQVVDAYGPERLMWASDCPYQVQGKHNYADSIALIRDHADFLSESDKQWMLRKTAEKLFFT